MTTITVYHYLNSVLADNGFVSYDALVRGVGCNTDEDLKVVLCALNAKIRAGTILIISLDSEKHERKHRTLIVKSDVQMSFVLNIQDLEPDLFKIPFC